MKAKSRAAQGVRVSFVAVIANTLLVIAKILVGLAVGSGSMVADAINNLSDAASSLVGIVGFSLAKRPADQEHPFGHGRFEYLAGLVVAIMVCAVGLMLVRDAIDRILAPETIDFGPVVIAVMLGAMLVKLAMFALQKKAGSLMQSQAVAATAQDSLNDILVSLAVLISAAINHLFGIDVDGIIMLGLALFVIYSGVQLVGEATSVLLGQSANADLTKRVQQIILSYPEVLGTHHLMMHDYGPANRFATIHVKLPENMSLVEAHDICDKIEDQVQKQEGLDLTIHAEPLREVEICRRTNQNNS